MQTIFLRCSLLLALVSSLAPLSFADLACTNQPTDTAAIQAAVNVGGPLRITGTCNTSSGTVQINKPVAITGGATFNAARSVVFSVNADTVSISGMIFNGKGVYLSGITRQYFTFVENKVWNITDGSDGLNSAAVLRFSHLDRNNFYNIAPPNFVNYKSAGDMTGSGMNLLPGLDNTTVEDNVFDLISADGVHAAWDTITTVKYYFETKNVSLSYNLGSRIHRALLEIQTATRTTCGPAYNLPCHFGPISSSNFKVAGNYNKSPHLGFWNSFGFSLVPGNGGVFINNAAINTLVQPGRMAWAQETAATGDLLVQGNVYATSPGATPWLSTVVMGGGRAGTTWTFVNNILCTPGEMTNNFGKEGPYHANRDVIQYNVRSNVCPNAETLNTSAIALNVEDSTAAGSNRTWKASVVSTLPIKFVDYYLDNAPAAFARQEIQDVNTNFANDRKWLYHGTTEVSKLTGTHNLRVVATDVSNAAKTVSRNFSVDGSVVISEPDEPPVVTVPPPVVIAPAVTRVGGWLPSTGGPAAMDLIQDRDGTLVASATATGAGAAYALIKPVPDLKPKSAYVLTVTGSQSKAGAGLNASIGSLSAAPVTFGQPLAFTTGDTVTDSQLRLDITGFGTGDVLRVAAAVTPASTAPVVTVPAPSCDVTVTFTPVTVKCASGSTCPVSGSYSGSATCH